MSILIVEDDKISAAIVERILRSQNYATIVADTGVAALKMLRCHPQIELVVADIMMPEMSGLEMLRQIKDSFLFQDTPVILCSAATDLGNVRMAAALGCHYFLVKPVQKDLLLQKVTLALSKTVPVLASMQDVMSRLNIDQRLYFQASDVFAALLRQEIKKVEDYCTHRSAAAIDPQYQQLSRNADFFGARQLRSRIEAALQLTGNSADLHLELIRLSWEMQRVLNVLSNRNPPAKDSINAGAPDVRP